MSGKRAKQLRKLALEAPNKPNSRKLLYMGMVVWEKYSPMWYYKKLKKAYTRTKLAVTF